MPSTNKAENATNMVSQMMNPKGTAATNGFTLGWDIVVSYSEKEINALLAERYEKPDSKMLKKITFETEDIVVNVGKRLKQTYHLTIGPPSIKFKGGAEPTCELRMDIESGYLIEVAKSGRDQEPITRSIAEENNSFRIRIRGIKLGTLSGNYQEVTEKLNSTTRLKLIEAMGTIKFPQLTDTTHTTSWIVLNIPATGDNLQVNVERLGKPEKTHAKAGNLEEPLTNLFKDPTLLDAIEYSIVSLNNKPNPEGGLTTDLRPEAFRISSFSSDAHPDSILSLFIKTAASQSCGQEVNLQHSWSGIWADNNTLPIPDGYTASVIMSPYMVYEGLIRPGMEGDGEYNLSTEVTKANCRKGAMNDTEDGIRLSATWQRKWTQPHQKDEYSSISTYEVYSTSTDIKNSPIFLHLKQKDASELPIVNVRWEFSTDAGWKDHSAMNNWGDGKLRTTYNVDVDTKCTVKLTDQSLEIGIPTDKIQWLCRFMKSPGSEERNDIFELDPPEDARKKVESAIGNCHPPLAIKTMGLGFFSTTNLLMPVIDFDKDFGLRIPRDLLLLGNVVGKVK